MVIAFFIASILSIAIVARFISQRITAERETIMNHIDNCVVLINQKTVISDKEEKKDNGITIISSARKPYPT